MILKARIVLPIASPPIRHGAVQVSDGKIKWVGPASELSITGSDDVVDLQDSILLPGLINAHCHLDYTHMAGLIPPQRRFTDWIKLITTAKAGWSYTEYAASWIEGARMLVETGTTTVADVEVCPELLPDVWSATPLRVHSFLEMTGVKNRRNPKAILQETIDIIDSLPAGRSVAGLSPHAPYSTTPELLRLTSDAARERQWRIVTHVAESELEFRMFTKANGEMHDWLARNERDNSDCGQGTPVEHLHRHGLLGENLIAIHANCLESADVRLLARHQVNVVHCPRSHQFFQHPPFDYDALSAAGINICLGTDSLASIAKPSGEILRLDMFAEMVAFAKLRPSVPPETVLRMATMNGAQALGMAGICGEITPGAAADLIAIPFRDKESDAGEAVINHQGPVRAGLIDGDWAVRPD